MIYSTLGYRTLDPVYLRFKKNWSHPVGQNVQPETLAYDAILFFVTFLLQFFNESYILSQEVYITIYKSPQSRWTFKLLSWPPALKFLSFVF